MNTEMHREFLIILCIVVLFLIPVIFESIEVDSSSSSNFIYNDKPTPMNTDKHIENVVHGGKNCTHEPLEMPVHGYYFCPDCNGEWNYNPCSQSKNTLKMNIDKLTEELKCRWVSTNNKPENGHIFSWRYIDKSGRKIPILFSQIEWYDLRVIINSVDDVWSKDVEFEMLEYLEELLSLPKETDAVEFGEWQLCPMCFGSGIIGTSGITSSTFQACTVCNGYKVLAKPIIHKP